MTDGEQDPTQAQLDGMPEEKKVVPRFLHLVEIGVREFATTIFLLQLIANAPRGQSEDAALFKRAYERMDSLVLEQIGLRAWEDALEIGLQNYHDLMDAARERTTEEEHA